MIGEKWKEWKELLPAASYCCILLAGTSNLKQNLKSLTFSHLPMPTFTIRPREVGASESGFFASNVNISPCENPNGCAAFQQLQLNKLWNIKTKTSFGTSSFVESQTL